MSPIANAGNPASMYMKRKVELLELCRRYSIEQLYGTVTDIFNGLDSGEFLVATRTNDNISDMLQKIESTLRKDENSQLSIYHDIYHTKSWNAEKEGYTKIYDHSVGILV